MSQRAVFPKHLLKREGGKRRKQTFQISGEFNDTLHTHIIVRIQSEFVPQGGTFKFAAKCAYEPTNPNHL